MLNEISPVSGIIQEDQVTIDFGEHEGKSLLEIADTEPEFYDYLLQMKTEGKTSLKRGPHKSFMLYVSRYIQ